ncbi:uncharacterized protein LOC122387728 [Amphibalanus amphitrite]|uniref:uncharacterized protein LOC122387728 n=1 Tax=Amphibalanus amphitrite TaxID=1232801 RepID=UPI001C929651|nr:uncharacterized protein LOC122387728 [Amphibalanus amphitrite]
MFSLMPMKIWILAFVPALMLHEASHVLCSPHEDGSLVRVARETDQSVGLNETEYANRTGDTGDNSLPSTIYPPSTTIREKFGFTAETGSTGSPFLQVKASPPTTGAMTGSAGTRPMIIVGSIMLAGCAGGAVYLWYLRKAKLDAEHADVGGELIPMHAEAAPEPGGDPDDEEEDAVPEP